MARPTRAVIDLEALAYNAQILRGLCHTRRLMAVVKADAYGHGLVRCAQTLAPSVDALAVAFFEEAQTLRDAGITTPVLVLEGPMAAGEVEAFQHQQLWSVIHRPEQLHWFENATHAACSDLWIKVDTGMHRLGLDMDMDTLGDIIRRAKRLTGDKVTLMSHLATAGDLEHPMAKRQLSRWQTLREHFDVEASLLNSASTLLTDDDDSHWLRPGYLFYGGHPDGLGANLGVKPVMRLQSEVIATRTIAAGEQVGYGGRWTAPRDSRIATIPIGYADGYPRGAADGTPVLVGGHRVPMAGRVSMDMITVDITAHDDIRVGAPAELWGEQPSVDEVADHSSTIGYELTAQVTARVPRQVIRPTDGVSARD